MSCPTCEQEIDMEFVNDQWDKHELQVAGYTIAIKDVQGELEEIENENQIHREAARRTREWETLYRSVDTSISTTIFDKAQVESQIRELEDKVKEARESLNEIIDENTRRERHNTRISIIGEQTSDFESELDGITNSLGRIEDKLSILEILKKAFSTNGLLAYKIESLVKELEDLTNEY